MKHTKGLWKFYSNYHNPQFDYSPGADDTFHVVNSHLTLIAKVKNETDARLIAAAPELLKALEKAYLQILEFLNEGDFKREVKWNAGYIIDAIAKAKGGQK